MLKGMRTGKGWLRGAVRDVTDLLAPTWCVGCHAAGTQLCRECHYDLRLLMRRPFRAEDAAMALPITAADSTGMQVLPVISAARYQTLVAEVVVAFKDHERVGLVHALAPALARALCAAAEDLLRDPGALLIWPPDSRRAQLKRGRSPMGELIAELLRSQGIPPGMKPAGHLLRHAESFLTTLPGGSGQKSRSKVSRRAAASPFQLMPGKRSQLEGVQVILADDVLTSGATLHRLYALLASAGALVRGGVVLAATPQAESRGKTA